MPKREVLSVEEYAGRETSPEMEASGEESQATLYAAHFPWPCDCVRWLLNARRGEGGVSLRVNWPFLNICITSKPLIVP
jgi:hypothetical protein